MAEVMRHRFTEVPLAIFNINGTIRRNIKSKLIQCLHLEEVSSGPSYISVVDMGFIWRIYMPNGRRQKQTSHGVIMLKIYSILKARHPSAEKIRKK